MLNSIFEHSSVSASRTPTGRGRAVPIRISLKEEGMSRVSLFVAVVLGVAPLEVASQLTGRWYEEACEGGSADACNVFGSMYLLVFERSNRTPRFVLSRAMTPGFWSMRGPIPKLPTTR